MIPEWIQSHFALKTIFERVRAIPPADAGHDFYHTLRVAGLTEKIYQKEIERGGASFNEFEREQAWAAALLHDCVPVAKDSPLRKESSRLCSEKAREWLHELEWGVEAASGSAHVAVERMNAAIDEVADAILTHSFSANIEPRSLLGRCLQDADRLEALGALGLYRTIATGVSMGAKLFDPADPWAENRALDDRRYTIDHFYTKLLKLPDTFKTESARGEAHRRAQFLKVFLDQLKSEI